MSDTYLLTGKQDSSLTAACVVGATSLSIDTSAHRMDYEVAYQNNRFDLPTEHHRNIELGSQLSQNFQSLSSDVTMKHHVSSIGKIQQSQQQTNAMAVASPYHHPQALMSHQQPYWNHHNQQQHTGAPTITTISSQYNSQFYGYVPGSPSKQQHPLFQSHPRQDLPPPPFSSGSRFSANSPREKSSSYSRPQQSAKRQDDSISAADAYAALIHENGPSYSNYGSISRKIHSTTQRTSTDDSYKNNKLNSIPSSRSKENLTIMALSQPPKAPSHRRSGSDVPGQHHRRSNSDISARRGSGGGGKRPPTEKSRKKIDTLVQHQRSSSYGGSSSRIPLSRNGSNVGSAGSTSSMAAHRRGSSIASIASEASMRSVVSDIRRSTFFTVNEKTGEAQLSFPHENVHLILIDEQEAMRNSSNHKWQDYSSVPNYSLRIGRLYKVPPDEEEFEEYHMASVSEDPAALFGDHLFDYDASRDCRCYCYHCTHCAGKKVGKLSANYYCLAVDDGLYRRLIDEISSSQTMPCGTFFCGHHKDVRRPSIFIPVVILVLFFGSIALAAYFFGL